MALQQLEFAGLERDASGRSCTVNGVCGEHMQFGDVLRLFECVVSRNGNTEHTVECVKVVNGIHTCTVGFVPLAMCHLPKAQEQRGLHRGLKNTCKRSKSHQNQGIQ